MGCAQAAAITRREPCYGGGQRLGSTRENAMAKGQMKPNKEKKKPKADKNKKPKHQPFGGATPQGQTGHPGFNPFAKKG
jgi:hypothetical protein